MTIIEKSINELREYENNPRHNEHAVAYVANSIREFGFRVPIIIDRDGEIIAGHTRYKAAQTLGYDKVPCVIADDLTSEQVIAFRLADNKTAQIAGWDFAMLDRELAELVGLEMETFGFVMMEEYNIDELFEDNDKPPKEKPVKRVKCPHCGSVVNA